MPTRATVLTFSRDCLRNFNGAPNNANANQNLDGKWFGLSRSCQIAKRNREPSSFLLVSFRTCASPKANLPNEPKFSNIGKRRSEKRHESLYSVPLISVIASFFPQSRTEGWSTTKRGTSSHDTLLDRKANSIEKVSAYSTRKVQILKQVNGRLPSIVWSMSFVSTTLDGRRCLPGARAD